MIKTKGKKFPFQYFSRYVSFMHGLGCGWLWVVAYFFITHKLILEKVKFRSLYFSLIASILEYLWYLCTALRTGSSIPFVANTTFFGIARPTFGTREPKHSMKISAIFWLPEITIIVQNCLTCRKRSSSRFSSTFYYQLLY